MEGLSLSISVTKMWLIRGVFVTHGMPVNSAKFARLLLKFFDGNTSSCVQDCQQFCHKMK